MSDIDDILNGETDADDGADAGEGGSDQATETEQADNDSQDTATGEGDQNTDTGDSDGDGSENEDSPPGSEDSDDKPWTKTAVLDERRKRQEAESQVEALTKRLSQLEQGATPTQQEQTPSRPDVLEDAEGAFKHTEQKLSAEVLQVRAELSAEIMRSAHSDFDELEQEFIQLAGENPALVQQLRQSPNPAKFAYETARNAREMNKLTDKTSAEQMRNQMREEIRKELEQEQAEAQAKQKEKDDALMPSLSSARSEGGHEVVTEETLDDILGS